MAAKTEETAARTDPRTRPGLAAIERVARQEFERGEYGVSELSGEPIGFGRLSEAIPWARLTVQEEEDIARRA